MTGALTDFRALAGSGDWTDYTLSVKARRTGGSGGLLVVFRAQDNASWFALHLGAPGSAAAYIERSYNQISTRLPPSYSTAIETGRWYDVAIDVQGPRIRCSLDGKPILTVDDAYSPITLPTLEAIANRLDGSGEILLKMVNFSTTTQKTAVRLEGAGDVASEGTETILSSASQEDENTLDQPKKVAPVTRPVSGLGRQFDYTLAPNSVTVLRIKAHNR
jgi:alpha-L-arabinofuranosidase